MALLMDFIAFLISTVLIHSGEAREHLKSIKLNEKIFYDCVDIYKQPSLSHPLLKNHKIQMKPSRSTSEPNVEVPNEGHEKKIRCSNGTVPILRIRDEDIMNAQRFADNHFNPFTADSPGTHIAGVRTQGSVYHGAAARMSIHLLDVGMDQASYTQVYVGSGANGQINVIQAGWMINPSLFGEGRAWSYGYWKGNNGAGCYNTACQGFIQVSKDKMLSAPLSSEPHSFLRFSIHQDKQTGNWWITQINSNGQNVDVGYWPNEFFNIMADGAAMVGFGGAVQASPYGPSPPMGNGKFPTRFPEDSAIFSNVEIINSNYVTYGADQFPIEQLADSQCYRLRYKGNVFFYGGPAQFKCGV